MNNKIITNDDLIKELPLEAQERIRQNVEDAVNEWGGKRANAGRKTKTGTVLKLCIKVTEKEKEFINYARSHNLDYDQLMQG